MSRHTTVCLDSGVAKILDKEVFKVNIKTKAKNELRYIILLSSYLKTFY
jgi:hypothetical protein